jgi:hypothetical protein
MCCLNIQGSKKGLKMQIVYTPLSVPAKGNINV